MNCAQFEEIVHDLDRPGTAGFALRESALAHAESCSHCGILVMESESLDVALRALASQRDSQQPSPRMAAALMEEFRGQKFASLSRRVKRQIQALGVAAAILLAAGISLRVWHSSATPTVSLGHRDAPVATLPALADHSAHLLGNTDAAPVSVLPGTEPNHGSGESTGPAGRGPKVVSQQAEPDAEFVRLPYADSGALDDDAVVRVVLTPSALVSFGLPVTGIVGDETVQADLALSQDGTPQAIRLVSQTGAANRF